MRYCLLILSLFLGSLALPALAQETCRTLSRECVEGPETRTINGKDFFRECWRYEEEQYCETGEYTDTCQGISGSCEQTRNECVTNKPDGSCAMRVKEYACGEKQTNAPATLLDSSYTVVQDELDTAQCEQYSDNASCEITGETCIEGPETRNINGKDIYKSCWKWDYEYTCYQNTTTNYCQPLKSFCEVTEETCIDTRQTGECIKWSRTYDCASEQTEKEGIKFVDSELQIVEDSWDTEQCDALDGECLLESRECVEGAETRNINGLPVYKDCWRYESTYTCGNGEWATTCDSIDQNRCEQSERSCVTRHDNGECMSWAISYQCEEPGSDKTQLNCGEQQYCVGEDCYDVGYEPNNSFGLAAAYLGGATKAGTERTSEDDLDIFTARQRTCQYLPLSTLDCCDDSGWANGSQVGCGNKDLMLIEDRRNKLTHYVGTYCAKEIPLVGTCVKYEQSYCAYNSMLARIIQQGAHAQLNIPWGSPESPNCEGLKPSQLREVDFTKIDFTEYINEMQVDMVDKANIKSKVEDRVSDMLEEN